MRDPDRSRSAYRSRRAPWGPSLGRDNLDKGVTALIVGMAGVFPVHGALLQASRGGGIWLMLAKVLLLAADVDMHQVCVPGIAASSHRPHGGGRPT